MVWSVTLCVSVVFICRSWGGGGVGGCPYDRSVNQDFQFCLFRTCKKVRFVRNERCLLFTYLFANEQNYSIFCCCPFFFPKSSKASKRLNLALAQLVLLTSFLADVRGAWEDDVLTRLDSLELASNSLIRQTILQQFSQEEARRSDGDSGLKQVWDLKQRCGIKQFFFFFN